MKIGSFILPILERPAIYCINNVEDLYLIILGYTMGAQDKETYEFMSNFRDFVNRHFKSKNDVDWPRLIRFNSSSDKHSLELFSQIFSLALGYIANELPAKKPAQ